MDSDLFKALYEQFSKYLVEISGATKNLMTFLGQNKDFRSMLDVSILVYIKSADLRLSCEHHELRSSPDVQIIGGNRTNLRDMCAELAQAVAE